MPDDKDSPQHLLEAQLLTDSPLKEIERDSLQELFRRINDYLALGLPEEVPDSDLDEMIITFRARRFKFITEQETKAQNPVKRKGGKKAGLQLLDDL